MEIRCTTGKEMCIEAFNAELPCCVNDTVIYVPKLIPCHEPFMVGNTFNRFVSEQDCY